MFKDKMCDKFSHDGYEKPCPVANDICDDCQYLEECDDCDKTDELKRLLDEERTKNEKLKETINEICGLKIQVPKDEENPAQLIFAGSRMKRSAFEKHCNNMLYRNMTCTHYSNMTFDEKLEVLFGNLDLSIETKIKEWRNKASIYDADEEYREQINNLFINFGYLSWDRSKSTKDLITKINVWEEKSKRYDKLIDRLSDECDYANDEL